MKRLTQNNRLEKFRSCFAANCKDTMFSRNMHESDVDKTTEYSLVPLLNADEQEEFCDTTESARPSTAATAVQSKIQTTISICPSHRSTNPHDQSIETKLCGGFNWITVLCLSTLLSWFLWSGYRELSSSWKKRDGLLDDPPHIICPIKLRSPSTVKTTGRELTEALSGEAQSNRLYLANGSLFETTSMSRENLSMRGCHNDVIAELILHQLNRVITRRREESALFVTKLMLKAPSVKQDLFIAHNNLTVTGFGLGNFMFILATMYGLARNTSRSVALLESHKHEAMFENLEHFVQHREKADLFDESTEVLHEKNWAIFDPDILGLTANYPNENILLDGYRQVFRIFDDYKQDIRAMFAFKPNVTTEAIAKIRLGLEEYFQRTNKTYHVVPKLVGVHVRRGDILTGAWHDMGHEPATEEYLLRTVLHMETEYAPVIFLVISNGIEYCKEVFKEDNFIFMEHHDSTEVDMALLTLMDYLVLSVGTFGWWGAYLSEAREIHYYRDWPRNGTVMKAGINPKDFWPSEWIAGI